MEEGTSAAPISSWSSAAQVQLMSPHSGVLSGIRLGSGSFHLPGMVVNDSIISCPWIAISYTPEISRRRARCHAELSF